MGLLKKRIAILGSTGSVGRQTLELIARYPERFEATALAAGRNVQRLAEQVARFRPLAVSVQDEAAREALAQLLAGSRGPKPELLVGEAGASAIAAKAPADRVVAAFVGAAGLAPTLAAVEAGREVALANKEVLVMAGELVTRAAGKSGAKLLPVDSEHCALHQVLSGKPPEQVHRLVLTASGGPFLDLPEAELAAVTPARAVKHPRWEMGAKISVDSATLLNKGFEVIEARWLFGVPVSRIGIVVHPEAIVHSLVEFVDGSTLAQLGVPDMAIPIAYALAWPDRLLSVTPHCDLAKLARLHFREVDTVRFPAIALASRAASAGGTAAAALVAADDVAVEAFLEGRIGFLAIGEVLAGVLDSVPTRSLQSLQDVRDAVVAAREAAQALVRRAGGRRAAQA